MNLQNSGECCRENAHVRHRPRRRTIQYSEASVGSRKVAAYWIPAFAGMTAVGAPVLAISRCRHARNRGQSLVLHCSKTDKIAPAKGAMAIAAASLYWCRRQGWGCVEAHLVMIRAGGNMGKLILAAASAAALALAGLSSGPASAQSPIVIKFSHVVDRKSVV